LSVVGEYLFDLDTTDLLGYILEVCMPLIILFESAVSFFAWFGIVVSCDALVSNILEHMFVGMSFRKMPVFLREFILILLHEKYLVSIK
jgi:hypothetical protein